VTWYIFGLVFYLLNEIEVCDMFLKTWSFSFWVHDFREPFVCPGPLKFWFYTLDDVSASGDGPRWWWQASSAVTAHSTCCTLKHEGNIRSVPDLKDTPERQRGTPMAFCSFTWPFCLWSNDSGGARPSNSSSPFPSRLLMVACYGTLCSQVAPWRCWERWQALWVAEAVRCPCDSETLDHVNVSDGILGKAVVASTWLYSALFHFWFLCDLLDMF
jgi:hypothetical protein